MLKNFAHGNALNIISRRSILHIYTPNVLLAIVSQLGKYRQFVLEI